jgi:hypothetical protein
MPITLTDDMRAFVAGQRLCFAATVGADGRPNLSPKGSIRVLDEGRLFFLDIASPGTRQNLETNPWIELNVVDPLSRLGYRFMGRGRIHAGDEIHARALDIIEADEGVRYKAGAAIVVEVEKARPLISPGYEHTADEEQMRAHWRARRAELEEGFEKHVIGARGYWKKR